MSEKILRLVGCRKEEAPLYINLLIKSCYGGNLNPSDFKSNEMCEDLTKVGLLEHYENGSFKITRKGGKVISILEMEEDLGFSNF